MDFYGLESQIQPLASFSSAVEQLSILCMFTMGPVHFVSALAEEKDEFPVLEGTGRECKRCMGLPAKALACILTSEIVGKRGNGGN